MEISFTFDNSLALLIDYIGVRTRTKFISQCLKKDKVTFTHKKIVNVYIVNKIKLLLFGQNDDFTWGNALFGSLKVTKNADKDKYNYSGFDNHGIFSLPNGRGFGKNVIISEAYMSSSVHVDSKKKEILFLGRGPIDGLDDTTLTLEKGYLINFTGHNKRFCLSLHYNFLCIR